MTGTAHSFDLKLLGCQSVSAESERHCGNVNFFFFFANEIIC